MATINVIPNRKIKKDIIANTGIISGEVDTVRIETVSADITTIDADTLTATTVNATNVPEQFTELAVDANPTSIPSPGNYILTAGGQTNVDIGFGAVVGDIIKVTTEEAATTFTVTVNHYNNDDPPTGSTSFTVERGNIAHLQYNGTLWVPLNTNFTSS